MIYIFDKNHAENIEGEIIDLNQYRLVSPVSTGYITTTTSTASSLLTTSLVGNTTGSSIHQSAPIEYHTISIGERRYNYSNPYILRIGLNGISYYYVNNASLRNLLTKSQSVGQLIFRCGYENSYIW